MRNLNDWIGNKLEDLFESCDNLIILIVSIVAIGLGIFGIYHAVHDNDNDNTSTISIIVK